MSDWDALLDEFRELGGKAGNICLRNGPHGLGLFLVDPTKPPELHIPENLLLSVDDVVFENNKLKIASSSKHTDRERAFLETYEEKFSWGAGSRGDVERYFGMMQQIPEKARDLLATAFTVERRLFDSPSDEVMQQRYIGSRSISHHDKSVLMPILGLANHGEGGAFKSGDGITLGGTFAGDEVLVRYAEVDSLEIFKAWGFASTSVFAHSLPLQLPLKVRTLVITRQFRRKARLGQLRVPTCKVEGDKIQLSYMTLGNKQYQAMPKGVFLKMMRGVNAPNPADLFDEIHRFNSLKFLELLELVENETTPAAALLRKVIRYQLGSMAHHRGARQFQS